MYFKESIYEEFTTKFLKYSESDKDRIDVDCVYKFFFNEYNNSQEQLLPFYIIKQNDNNINLSTNFKSELDQFILNKYSHSKKHLFYTQTNHVRIAKTQFTHLVLSK